MSVRKKPANSARGFHARPRGIPDAGRSDVAARLAHVRVTKLVDAVPEFQCCVNRAGVAADLVDGEACPKHYIEGTSERHQDNRMTRRGIFIRAAAALLCAPAIVRAASLMPVPGLPLQFLKPLGEFYRRCFYHSLESDLRAGRSMTTVTDGKIISVAEARRMVVYARAQGWLANLPV